jgi:hypothetical protein
LELFAGALARMFKQGANPRTLMIGAETWRRLRQASGPGAGLEWAERDGVRLSRLPNENMYVAMLRPEDKPGGAGWKNRRQRIFSRCDLDFLKRQWEIPTEPEPARVVRTTPAAVDFPRPLSRLEQQLPLVSCIMPTYNRQRFVPLATQYFLRQTYPLKELIVADGGGPAHSFHGLHDPRRQRESEDARRGVLAALPGGRSSRRHWAGLAPLRTRGSRSRQNMDDVG